MKTAGRQIPPFWMGAKRASASKPVTIQRLAGELRLQAHFQFVAVERGAADRFPSYGFLRTAPSSRGRNSGLSRGPPSSRGSKQISACRNNVGRVGPVARVERDTEARAEVQLLAAHRDRARASVAVARIVARGP